MSAGRSMMRNCYHRYHIRMSTTPLFQVFECCINGIPCYIFTLLPQLFSQLLAAVVSHPHFHTFIIYSVALHYSQRIDVPSDK